MPRNSGISASFLTAFGTILKISGSPKEVAARQTFLAPGATAKTRRTERDLVPQRRSRRGSPAVCQRHTSVTPYSAAVALSASKYAYHFEKSLTLFRTSNCINSLRSCHGRAPDSRIQKVLSGQQDFLQWSVRSTCRPHNT